MAKQYKVTPAVRRVNRVMTWLTRVGLGGSELLTTTGRRTGREHTAPVSPMVIDGEKYIVSPYGAVSWVWNVRADPKVTLTRGRKTEERTLEEVTGRSGTAALVATYYANEGFARPYMDVPEDPAVEDFEAVADRFPIFRVR